MDPTTGAPTSPGTNVNEVQNGWRWTGNPNSEVNGWAPPAGYTGGSGGGMGGNGPAAPNLQSIYNTAYTNNPDVAAAQKSIDDLNGQISTRSTARDTAEKNINDNPFYAEATRVGQVQKLNTDYNNDVNTLNGQLTTATGKLTGLQAEAQRQVNLATGQYDINRQQYQDTLSRFNMLLNAGAFGSASSSDLATISAQTGISPSMLQSIQNKQNQDNVTPQIIPSTDNNGNVTITAVDKKTGAIINQEQLGGVGKASKGYAPGQTDGTLSGGGSSGKAPAATQVDFNNTATGTSWIKTPAGQKIGQFPQLVAQYAAAMSLPQIYKAYANSPLGKQYGTPTESAAFIKNVYDTARGKASTIQ